MFMGRMNMMDETNYLFPVLKLSYVMVNALGKLECGKASYLRKDL